jgi:hypothetical protein
VHDQPLSFEFSLYDSGIGLRTVRADGSVGPEAPETTTPSIGVAPGNWDRFLEELPTANVTYAGQTLYEEQVGNRFRFENMDCPWREQRAAGLWEGSVECYGEVITDLEFQPAQIRAWLRLDRHSPLSKVEFDIQFQQFELADRSIQLLPAMVEVKAKYKHVSQVYTASSTLSDYRPFASDHVIRME